MCIEIIANQQNLFCVWEMHNLGRYVRCFCVGHFNVSKSRGAKIITHDVYTQNKGFSNEMLFRCSPGLNV